MKKGFWVRILMVAVLLSQGMLPFASAGAGIKFGDLSVVSFNKGISPMNSVAYGNGRYVGVAGKGAIYVSTNGIDWEASSQLASSNINFYTVEFAEGVFVIGGNNDSASEAKLYSSADGYTWTGSTVAASFIKKVRYLNGDFYALGAVGTGANSTNKGIIFKSADGVGGWSQWGTQINRGTYTNNASTSSLMILTDIAYVNNTYVVGSAIFQSVFYSSDNGNQWTQKQLRMDGASYGVSQLAAVGSKLYVSTNEMGYSSTNGVDYSADSVADHMVGWLASGGNDYLYGGGTLKESSDGQSWTNLDATSTWISGMASDGAGKGVLIAGNGAALMYSPDMQHWNYLNSDYSGIAANASGTYAVVGTTGSNPYDGTASSGASWSALVDRQPTTRSGGFSGVASNGSGYVAAGKSIGTSADGVTWNMSALPAAAGSDKMFDIAYGNGLYVAVGEKERIITSPDGVTWTSRRSGTQDLMNVKYVNGEFVALGTDRLLHSADGTTWLDARGTYTALEYVNITYANGNYVIIINDADYEPATIKTTSLGSAVWSEQKLSQPANTYFYPYDITYGDGRYVAVGSRWTDIESPLIMQSTDGLTWTAYDAAEIGLENGYQAVYFKDNTFYLAGSKGLLAELSSSSPAPTYTLTYDANGSTGGSAPIDASAYAQNASVTVAGNTGSLTKSGYTFDGWNTQANGSGTDYAVGATYTMGAANATLYAKWLLAPTAPTVTDSAASALSTTTASASGKVNDNGASTAVSFEYGLTTSYGSEKTADVGSNIAAGSGQQNVSATLSGLQPGQTYHVRIKAVNSVGTSYGSDTTVTTLPASDPTINPTTGNFDKNPAQQQDVTTTVTTNGYTLTSITSGGTTVAASVYELSGSTLTIKKEFLATLSTGPSTLTLHFDSGTTQTLTITITDTTPPQSSTKAVGSFTLAGLNPSVSGTIDEANKTIALTVPYGTDVKALVPTIGHDGKSVVPASGAAQDFTNPVVYTVTAENNTTAAYTVTVTVAAAPVPAAPSLPSLSPGSDSGWSAFDQVTSNSTPKFSGTAAANVQVYLFADLNNNGILDNGELLGSDTADGSGKWDITSSHLNDGEYPIRAVARQMSGDYSAASGTTTVTIDNFAPSITSVEVPLNGTYSPGDSMVFKVHTDRIVAFANSGSAPRIELTIGSQTVYADYVSGSGSSVLTFSYTVVSGDRDADGISLGSSLDLNGTNIATQAGNALNTTLNSVGSTSSIIVGADSTKTLGSFAFDGLNPSVTGVVYEATRTIEVTVPYGTDVTALVPTVTHGGASLLPASGVPQDFSVPVTYTVTAADGSTAEYTVHVTIASNTSKEALDFRFAGLSPVVQGLINEANHTITATVPYGTNVTALAPTFSHSGASVQPASGIPQDFSSPVAYTVTAADGSTAVYTVTVQVALPSSDAQLDGLSLDGGTLQPAFSPSVKNYTASVANAVTAVNLLPHARHAGAHVAVNGTAVVGNSAIPVSLNVGSNTITVTVLAEDGVTLETYTLTVTRAEASNTPNPSNPNPSTGGSSGSNTTTGPAPSTTQRIEVDVDLGGGSSVVTKTIVERTKTASGTKDAVTLEPDKTKVAVDQAIAAGESTIRIVIPDVADEVSQTDVTLPIASLRTIASNDRNLEIATRDVRIAIPSGSLTGLSGDVYFRVVPIKESGKKTELLNRVTTETLVRDASSSAGLNPFVVARPMTIETNLQSREVKLTLPLSDVQLPDNPAQRQAFLDSLAIYVEHGDGDRELLRGTVVNYAGTQQGLAFNINKFSTFTILSWKGGNLAELMSQIDAGNSTGGDSSSAGESNTHRAYIRGYADGLFHPEASLTRAQLAMMVASLLGYDGQATSSAAAFPDVARTHWAAGAIAYVSERGYLIGDNTGSFRPNAAVTRAEMAALAIRLKPLGDALAPQAPFSDVASGHWASSSIAAARQQGLITGYTDGTFRPSTSMTRAEAVTTLNRVFGRLPLGGEIKPSWADVAPSYWAYGNIEEASRDHRFTVGEDAAEHLKP